MRTAESTSFFARFIGALATISLLILPQYLAGLSRAEQLGVDFGVFHLGARLARTEGFSSVYDHERFSQLFASDAYFPTSEGGISVFLSTPLFALLMQPFSSLELNTGLVIWTAGGLIAMIWVLRSLGMPATWVAALVLSPPAIFNFGLGQTGFFAVIWTALVLRYVADRSRSSALVGAAIVKPMLAFGIGVWWLINMRRRGANLLIAGLVATALAFLPFITSPLAPWRFFLGGLTERLESEDGIVGPSLTLVEFVKLSGLHDFGGTALWWSVSFAVGAAVLWRVKKQEFDSEIQACFAVWVTVLFGIHVLTYDALILAVPVVVCWRRSLLSRSSAMQIWGLITIGTAWFVPLSNVQLIELGFVLRSDFLCGLGAFVIFWRSVSTLHSAKLGSLAGDVVAPSRMQDNVAAVLSPRASIRSAQ